MSRSRRSPAPSPGAASGPVRPARETEWRPRPWLARSVRWTLNLFLLASAAAASLTVGYALPPWSGWGAVARVALLLATALAAAVVAERVTRRVMPLTLLLELSVSVPDQLPSRFRVALRAARVRDVNAAVLDAAEATEDADGPMTRMLVLLGALTAHDRRTRGHCERVRALNDLMADELRLSPEDRERLAWAALLHDIGKLHVPSSVLQKPGALDSAEWEALQAHPHLGALIVRPLRHWLGDWADAVGHHHERWDGTGYPLRLAGEEISYGGRIIALVDAFEVMTSARPYKRPISAEAARNELVRCSGEQFDPAMVRAFLNISIGKLRRVIGPLAWLAQLPVVGGASRVEALALATTRQSVAGTAAGAGAVAFSTAVTIGTLGGASAPAAAAGAHHRPPASMSLTAQAAVGGLAPPVGGDGPASSGRDAWDPASDARPSPSPAGAAAGPAHRPAGSAAPTGSRANAGADSTDASRTTPVDGDASAAPADPTDPTASTASSASSASTASTASPTSTASNGFTGAIPPGLSADPPGLRVGHPAPVDGSAPAASQGSGWGLTRAPAIGRRFRSNGGG
ncbi:MAG TPA: HD-GYP domain-containing protein [Acidimicrobiales bacterium]|nr:HD-GYP domain-containing protein [Acidimicrobiales bacterium]